MTFNKTSSSAMWSKIFGNIGCIQEPAVGGTLWKGTGASCYVQDDTEQKKIFRKQDMHASKNFSRSRKSVRGNHRNINHLEIWKNKVQLQTSIRTWNEGLKHGLFVSNQIKLTTKTRDVGPIPPEWKWLNIRRKERKKREGREGKRSPITKFCLTSV